MSAPDPLDEASARLFAALRDEQVPADAAHRALLAARAELETRPHAARVPRPLLWAAVLVGGALAAAFALSLRAKVPAERISAEPLSSLRSPHVERPVSSAAQAPAPSGSMAPLTPLAPRAPSPPAPSQSAPITLGDELAALKVASTALNAGDAAEALKALDRYEHVLKGKQLRAEATLLKLQALSQAGRAETASALAAQFVKQNPDSPLVDRARSYIQEK